MAPYQQLKLFLVDVTGLSKNGFHFILGFLVYVFFAKLFKLDFASKKSLIAPVVFALLLEILDLRDSLVYGDALNLLDSATDIILTISLPFAINLFAKLKSLKNAR